MIPHFHHVVNGFAFEKSPDFRRNPGIFLAYWEILCYAVLGASSTPVGGSPRFYGGDTSLPPIAREGVMVMVTWEGLFQFCMVIATVIALVIQAYNDKK